MRRQLRRYAPRLEPVESRLTPSASPAAHPAALAQTASTNFAVLTINNDTARFVNFQVWIAPNFPQPRNFNLLPGGRGVIFTNFASSGLRPQFHARFSATQNGVHIVSTRLGRYEVYQAPLGFHPDVAQGFQYKFVFSGKRLTLVPGL